jgi:hypothetical protein
VPAWCGRSQQLVGVVNLKYKEYHRDTETQR